MPIKINKFTDPRGDLDDLSGEDGLRRPNMGDEDDTRSDDEDDEGANYVQALLSNGTVFVS